MNVLNPTGEVDMMPFTVIETVSQVTFYFLTDSVFATVDDRIVDFVL